MFNSRALGLASLVCVAPSVAQAAPAKVPAQAAAKIAAQAAAKIAAVSLSRRFPAQRADVTRVFKPGDRTLHAIVRLAGAPSGDKVKAVWIIADAGGVKNYRFAETTLGTARGLDTLHFATSLKRDWPRGQYRLDLFWNGARAWQEYFEVK